MTDAGMMGEVAIETEGLGKRYMIGSRPDQYRTLRDALARVALEPVRRLRAVARGEAARTGTEEFWALSQLDLTVRQGEVLGVIGSNGAGKSTLLKILSRVTPPTTGRAVMHGRAGSLLEVGTGFHPELTGRENILLNGAILGMSRARIREEMDAIIEFSEISRFIDTPVKHYSSGMSVRLAFSVAAHLDPEILIIDEVLAVGDAAFQRKCLGRMHDVADSGRTVLFVSHNMGAVRQLCSRAIWLDAGRLRLDGDVGEVARAYLQVHEGGSGAATATFEADPSKALQVLGAELLSSDGTRTQTFTCDEDVCLRLHVEVRRVTPGTYGFVQFRASDGTAVLVADSRDDGTNPVDRLPEGRHHVDVVLPPRSLAAGGYGIYVSLGSAAAIDGFILDDPGVVLTFELNDDRTLRGNSRAGYLSTILDWSATPA